MFPSHDSLPFENMEDVSAIFHLSKKVLDMARRIDKGITITVSVSNFVPKSNTPFQWEKQMDFEEMKEKHRVLRELFKTERRLTLKIHEKEISYLEGIISRGDEKTGKLVKRVVVEWPGKRPIVEAVPNGRIYATLLAFWKNGGKRLIS